MLQHIKKPLLAAVALALLAAAPTRAQHADFVLFGDADPEMAAVPQEHQFIHPITSPYYHDNSFITSDIRVWYLFHEFSNNTLGGDTSIVAAQVRLALTDRLQFVAYKDGYAWFDDTVVNDDGWMDIAAGLKYNFYRDIEEQLYLSAGIGYQLDLGEDEVLQDDEILRLWVSGDKGFDKLHLGGTVNYLIATDSESTLGNSDVITWHVHADYYLCEWFSPVVELNGYHTVDEGTVAVAFNGVDVANLGGGDGEDVITMGIGCEIKLCESAAVRAAYEFDLADNTSLFGERLTLSLVYDF